MFGAGGERAAGDEGVDHLRCQLNVLLSDYVRPPRCTTTPRTLTLYSGLQPLSTEPTTRPMDALQLNTCARVIIRTWKDMTRHYTGLYTGIAGLWRDNGREWKGTEAEGELDTFVYNIWERGNREGL